MAALAAAPVAASTYSNPGKIEIPSPPMDGTGGGVAGPYPSTINVDGLPGTVAKARATLNGVNHTWPHDIEALLVGPGGQKTVLMADVCGGGSTPLLPPGVAFTFDDAASTSLPEFPPPACVGGSYKPSSSSDPAEAINAEPPAPAPPYPVALSALNGGPSNGTWQLFVFDDSGGNSGSINGWSLELLPAAQCAGVTATQAAHVGTAGDDVLTGTQGPDVMLGLGGNDTIFGLAGTDVICGGPGNDKLVGGPGKDRLLGEAGRDNLRGGLGKDILKGDLGKDKLNGGLGNDVCKGGPGRDNANKSCEKQKSI